MIGNKGASMIQKPMGWEVELAITHENKVHDQKRILKHWRKNDA